MSIADTLNVLRQHLESTSIGALKPLVTDLISVLENADNEIKAEVGALEEKFKSAFENLAGALEQRVGAIEDELGIGARFEPANKDASKSDDGDGDDDHVAKDDDGDDD